MMVNVHIFLVIHADSQPLGEAGQFLLASPFWRTAGYLEPREFHNAPWNFWRLAENPSKIAGFSYALLDSERGNGQERGSIQNWLYPPPPPWFLDGFCVSADDDDDDDDDGEGIHRVPDEGDLAVETAVPLSLTLRC